MRSADTYRAAKRNAQYYIREEFLFLEGRLTSPYRSKRAEFRWMNGP